MISGDFMKKFFRDCCVDNAGCISAFIMVSLYLLIAWKLISFGSLLLQLLVVLWMLWFVGSAIAGAVITIVDVIRKLLAKKKNSAPTEVSADS